MSEPVTQRYTVTPAAGPFVAGRPNRGAGTSIELTATQALYELLVGAIVPDGTAVPVPEPRGAVDSFDRIGATRGSKAWDFSVGELTSYLFETAGLPALVGQRIAEAIDAFRRTWVGDAPAWATLAYLAGRLLEEAGEREAGDAAVRSEAAGGLAALAGVVSGLSLALTGKQAADPTLTALAALATAADRLVYAAGPDLFATAPLTAYARTLLAASDAAGMLAALGGNGAGGPAVLDANGKVPTAILPASVLGDLQYQGSWNASGNVPAIPAAAPANKGWYYVVTVAGGTVIPGALDADWQVGDWLVSNGATGWDKVDNTDVIKSVAGLTGAISAADLKAALALTASDVSGVQAQNSVLTALAALNLATDQLFYATGPGAVGLASLTSFARGLLAKADATALKGALALTAADVGLGSTASPTLAGLTLTAPLAVTSGGTGAATAVAARVNLGVGASNDVTFRSVAITAQFASTVVSGQARYYGLSLANKGAGLGTEIAISLAPNDAGIGARDVHLAAVQGSAAGVADFVLRTANGDAPVESLRVTAGGGAWLPGADAVTTVGSASKRIATYYGASSAISTSDLRAKVVRGAFSDPELDAWAEIRWCVFQMADAVQAKGPEAARLHAGLIAQEVEQAFARHGLQAFRYALWCADPLTTMQVRTRRVERPRMATTQVERTVYVATADGAVATTVMVDDTQQVIEWRDLYVDGEPVIKDDGAPRQVPVPMVDVIEESYVVEVPLLDAAGDPIIRLGLRYDHAHAFEAAWARREIQRLQGRLTTLEAQ